MWFRGPLMIRDDAAGLALVEGDGALFVDVTVLVGAAFAGRVNRALRNGGGGVSDKRVVPSVVLESSHNNNNNIDKKTDSYSKYTHSPLLLSLGQCLYRSTGIEASLCLVRGLKGLTMAHFDPSTRRFSIRMLDTGPS